MKPDLSFFQAGKCKRETDHRIFLKGTQPDATSGLHRHGERQRGHIGVLEPPDLFLQAQYGFEFLNRRKITNANG